MLLCGCLSKAADLEVVGGVIASGDKKYSPEARAGVCEGVGLLQAYGEASRRISGRPTVSSLGPLRLSRRLARSSSLVGGVECVSGDLFAEGTHTNRLSGMYPGASTRTGSWSTVPLEGMGS